MKFPCVLALLKVNIFLSWKNSMHYGNDKMLGKKNELMLVNQPNYVPFATPLCWATAKF
jgi:hypothetical protein